MLSYRSPILLIQRTLYWSFPTICKLLYTKWYVIQIYCLEAINSVHNTWNSYSDWRRRWEGECIKPSRAARLVLMHSWQGPKISKNSISTTRACYPVYMSYVYCAVEIESRTMELYIYTKGPIFSFIYQSLKNNERCRVQSHIVINIIIVIVTFNKNRHSKMFMPLLTQVC
jgi:hypothetical protein